MSFSKLKAFAVAALAVTALATISSEASAATCTESIKAIQIEADDGKLLVLFSNNTWHVLAPGSHAARSEILSLATTAKLSGKRLYLSYEGSSCTATDYGAAPTKVRLVD